MLLSSSLLRIAVIALVWTHCVLAAWVNLLNGKDLDGWEVIGDGMWTVMRDGTVLGQRDLAKSKEQSWLYTKKEYGEYDLHLEWWTRFGGNSGVSLRDSSRARWAVAGQW